MSRKNGKIPIITFLSASIFLHGLMFFLSYSASSWLLRNSSPLLMEVEIVGEGELREIEDSFQRPPEDLLDIPEPEPEPEPQVTKEIEPDEPKAEETPPPDIPQDEPPNPEESTPEEPIPEDQQPEALEDQQIEGAAPEETPSIEEVSNDEIEKALQEEKESEERAVQEEKNKAIAATEALNALKKIEKIEKKAKKKRKKLQEFAKKAAEDKVNKEFNKVLAKNMESSGGLGKKGRGHGAYGGGADLNDSDKANIMAQIVPYWAVASGIKDAESMIIEINMELRSNGEVIPSSIKILDESRYRSDGIFRAAADSAKRAILLASPLSMPRNKIALLQEVTLRFNMKEALGR